MNRKLDIDVTLHNVSEIQIEHCIGISGRKWLSFVFVDENGAKKEMAIWPPNPEDPAPTLIAESNVSIRRVQTIKELADD